MQEDRYLKWNEVRHERQIGRDRKRERKEEGAEKRDRVKKEKEREEWIH